MVVVSPAELTRGVRTRLNCGEKVISGSYTPSSDCNVVSAKRTLPRDTSMSLLFSSARRIAWSRVKGSSPPSTPTRVRSGAGGTGSEPDLSNGSSRRSLSGSGLFVMGSWAIAAVPSRSQHGRNVNEITFSNILIVLTSSLRLGLLRWLAIRGSVRLNTARGSLGVHLRTLLQAVRDIDDDRRARFKT